MATRFEISFGPGPTPGEYTTRMTTPDGVVEGSFTWGEEAVEAPLTFVNRWFAARGEQPRSTLAPLGEALYAALFHGAVGAALTRARRGPVDLVLSLPLDPEAGGRLGALPWELLRHDGAFLCLLPGFTLTRQWEVATQPRPAPGPTVHVLVVPSPTGSAPLDLQGEVHSIRAAFARRRDVRVELLARPTLSALWDALSREDVDVVHFAGHGTYKAGAGGALWMKDEAGADVALPAEDLAPHLARAGTRLVVLNACRSGAYHSAVDGGFGDVATTLIRRGVPAVVGMGWPVFDDAARAFSLGLYRALSRATTVAEAVGEGRRAVQAGHPHTTEWGVPVLMAGPHPVRLVERAGDDPETDRLLRAWATWLAEREGRLQLPMVEDHAPAAVQLDQVFVALRGAMADAAEWEAARQAVLDDVRRREETIATVDPTHFDRILHEQLSAEPLDLLFTTPRDAPHVEPSAVPARVSVADAFRSEPRLVILGHPGTGKTTLARWLVVRLAEGWLRGGPEVRVPAAQVDPEAPADAPDQSLGPPRIPIFLSVSAFAATWRDGREPSVEDHIGERARQFVQETGRPPTDAERLTTRLLGALAEGEAAVVLDGLDEVASAALRPRIVEEVDHFLGVVVPAARVTGPTNRVVVTSRIVGYTYTPLAHAVHYTLEPMRPLAVRRFAELWLGAAARAALRTDAPPPPVDAEVDTFLAQVAELDAVGAGELAKAPLSLAILLLVYRRSGGALPRQRTALYRAAVDAMLDRWRARPGNLAPGADGVERMLPLLAALATHIHDRAGASLIPRDELRRFLAQRVGRGEVEPLLRMLEADVGLLTARGEGVYGFFHLTFQEYLAGVHLAAGPAPVEEILRRLDAPRWCEPVLLAVGELGHHLDDEGLTSVAERMLAHPDPMRGLFPRASLLLSAAIPELPRVPAPLVEAVLDDLLAHRAADAGNPRFPEVRGWIEAAFSGLVRSAGPLLWTAVHRHLKPGAPPERLLAAAALVAIAPIPPAPGESDAGGLSRVGTLLLAAEGRDDRAWGWPVDRALRHLAGAGRLALPATSLRAALLRDEALRARYAADPVMVAIGAAVYGAVDHTAGEAYTAARAELAAIDAERADLKRGGKLTEDESKTLAARRALAEARSKPPVPGDPAEAVRWMHRDAPRVTRLLLDALRGDPAVAAAPLSAAQAQALAAALGSAATAHGDPDAALALALCRLGTEGLDASTLPPTVAARLDRALDAVAPALAGAVTQAFADPRPWMAQVGSGEDAITHSDALQRLAMRWVGRPDRVQPPWPDSPLGEALAADWLLYAVNTPGDDVRYNMAVTLDTLGDALAPTPAFLRDALARVPGRQAAQGPGARWPVRRLRGPSDTETERLARALAVLEALPMELLFVQSWAVIVLAPLLHAAGLAPRARRMVERSRGWDRVGDWEAAMHRLDHPEAPAPPRAPTLPPTAAKPLVPTSPLLSLAAAMQLFEGWTEPPVTDPTADALDALATVARAAVGGLHSDNLAQVYALAAHPDGRVRGEVARLVEGLSRIPASTVGTEALRAVAERSWAPETSPGHALLGAWLLNGVELDDPDQAGAWIRAAEGDETTRGVVASAGHIGAACWPVVVEGLRDGGPRTRRALLRVLCRVANRGKLPREVAPALADALATGARAGWGEIPVLVDGPGQIVAVVQEARARAAVPGEGAGASGDPPTAPGALARALDARCRRLGDLVGLDAEALQAALAAFGREHTGSAAVKHAAVAGGALGRDPGLFAPLVAWLAADLDLWLPSSGAVWGDPVGDLVGLLAAGAGRAPHAFLEQARRHPGLEAGLVRVATTGDRFTTRAAALHLLSYLRTLTPDIARALAQSALDVGPVQRAALGSLGRYRAVAECAFDPPTANPRVLGAVLDALTGEGAPATVEGEFLLASVLVTFARAATTPPTVRDRVIGWLRARIEAPTAGAEVWFQYTDEDAAALELHALGPLDRLLFGHLATLTGVADLHRRMPGSPR